MDSSQIEIEEAIDQELRNLSINASEIELDTTEEEDIDFSGDEDDDDCGGYDNPDDILDSVLTYFEASRNRVDIIEKLILEDLDENDYTQTEMPTVLSSHCEDLLTELASDLDEDPIRLKERIISEIEAQASLPILSEVDPQSAEEDSSSLQQKDDELLERDAYVELEKQLGLELRELEERLKEQEEQKMAKQKAEREHHRSSQREEEERRRRRLQEFEEDLRRLDKASPFQNTEIEEIDDHTEENLQLELVKQQELIRRLQEQMDGERRVFEEAQEEKRRRTEELRLTAATKIQAAFRAFLARRWCKAALKKRREEERRYEEDRKERVQRREREERWKREQEEEKRRREEEERCQREEMERRRAEYERAKEEERLRLERERKIEEQRKEEEEKKRKEEDERKRKEEVERRWIEYERAKEEERLRLERERKVEEQRKKEVERKIADEGEKRRKEVEERRRQEEWKKKAEEEKKKKEEEQKRKEEEKEKNSEERRGKVEQEDEEERRGKVEQEDEEERSRRLEPLPHISQSNLNFKNVPTSTRSSSNVDLTSDRSSSPRPPCGMGLTTHHSVRVTEGTDLGDSWTEADGLGERPKDKAGGRQCETGDGLGSPVEKAQDGGSLVAQDGGSRVAQDAGSLMAQDGGSLMAQDGGSLMAQDGSMCLPDSTEQKRLSWMMSCIPWSKLSMQNKRKEPMEQQPRRRGQRRAAEPSLPPLSVDTLLKTGAWSSLRQVTTVTLEDLPGCSLSTLAECTRLQSLTLRRCGLKALDGLSQCEELRHIDVQENSITFVDCGNLANLRVLLLGRNQLTSIQGLDGAVNLDVLQLSHNRISRISGLEPLKRLRRLAIDHNQVISTRGLREAFTLLHLDCSNNHLSGAEGLENCALLSMLDLTGNSLAEPPTLRNHVLLRELRLDDNAISSLEGLHTCWLPLLQHLSAAQNSVTQLPPLSDLISLKTLDVSHNCLSELRNVSLSLQGCTRLKELNLTDNPLQQETNWRSSLLEAVPGLLAVNGEQTGASLAPPIGPALWPAQQWSFRALCQAQLEQQDALLQRQSLDISCAPTHLDALLVSSRHGDELLQLAQEQRYGHEYGDSSMAETPRPEAGTDGCSPRPPASPPGQDQNHLTQAQHPADSPSLTPRGSHLASTPDLELPDNRPLQNYTEARPTQSQPTRGPTSHQSKLDLKNMAAVVIQRHWRAHRCSWRRDLPGLVPKADGKWSLYRKVEPRKVFPGPPNRDHAASVIQAVWRGYALRRRLAYALAQISEGDDGFEEVDVDEFIFDEDALESDWITPHSDGPAGGTPAFPEQLPVPKPLLPLPELHKRPPMLLWKPKQAWSSGERVVPSEQSLSPETNRSPASILGHGALSERSEKILGEWGFTSGPTALLMLKRAQKMKSSKQRQRKLLDPAVRLALFRSHSNQQVPVETGRKAYPERRGYLKARQAELDTQDALKAGQRRTYQERTYQWLHTQAVQSDRAATALGSDRFLPEIDPDILNGGRVQLVAGTAYRDGSDTAERSWAGAAEFSLPGEEHIPARRHSVGHAKKEAPSPKTATSAPSKKERISFRDNPVNLSGGWGGGKKRDKVHK